METNIQKWGNSLGVRLPQAVARQHNLQPGNRVRVTDTKEGITITLLKPQPASLDELVDAITTENRHQETDWSDDNVGNEAW